MTTITREPNRLATPNTTPGVRSTLLPALLALLMLPTLAAAQNATIAVQGSLMNAAGPVPDGDYGVTFAFYDAENAAKPLFEHIDAGVKVSRGVFSVTLGAKTKLDSAWWSAGKVNWIGVRVGSDNELARVPLHAVPYALRADIATSVACTGCITAGNIDPNLLATLDKQFKAIAQTVVDNGKGDAALAGTVASVNKAAQANAQAIATLSYNSLKDRPQLVSLGQTCKSGTVATGVDANGAITCGSGKHELSVLDARYVRQPEAITETLLKNSWYEFATTAAGTGSAIFTVRDAGTGSMLRFRLGVAGGDGVLNMTFRLLEHTHAGEPLFTTIRLLQGKANEPMHLYAKALRATSATVWIQGDWQSKGWQGKGGNMPDITGYKAHEYGVDRLLLVANGNEQFGVDRAGQVGIKTAPKAGFALATGGSIDVGKANVEGVGAVKFSAGGQLAGQDDGVGVTGRLSSGKNGVQRDIWQYNTAVGGAGYLHIKTSITFNSIMYCLEARGYNYGRAAEVFSVWCGYAYGGDGKLHSLNHVNHSGGFGTLATYKTKDGYVAVSGHMSSSYYMGLSLTARVLNPTGYGFAVKVLDAKRVTTAAAQW